MDKKYNVILDTDLGNSWDDQFALVYLLKCNDLFNVEAITIEQYKHNENESIYENEKNSFNEISSIGKLLNMDLEKITYKFSNNEATDKIIDIANKNDKTYILAIGGLTNINLAIRREPNIKDKIEIIWLGGNPFDGENNNEFNFMQDIKATVNVINSNVKMTIIPARNVSSDLMIGLKELKNRLDMSVDISKYLYDIFLNDNYYGMKTERVIWDISVIAYLINKDWFETKEIKGLSISHDLKYYIDSNGTIKTMVEKLDSSKIYDNLFEILKWR